MMDEMQQAGNDDQKVKALASAIETAHDAVGDVLDEATTYPTPSVGEHQYAHVLVDVLRYALEVIGMLTVLQLFMMAAQLLSFFPRIVDGSIGSGLPPAFVGLAAMFSLWLFAAMLVPVVV